MMTGTTSHGPLTHGRFVDVHHRFYYQPTTPSFSAGMHQEVYAVMVHATITGVHFARFNLLRCTRMRGRSSEIALADHPAVPHETRTRAN